MERVERDRLPVERRQDRDGRLPAPQVAAVLPRSQPEDQGGQDGKVDAPPGPASRTSPARAYFAGTLQVLIPTSR